jgi:cytochrome oxidase Cu insertion factor (SCO1/SenC/PrrC family)
VQVVMVTIDPERDTPEVMSTYVRYFDDGFVGLGGPPAEVHALLDAWGVSVQREGSNNASGDYYLSHPADVYVVDPAARQTVLEVPFGLPSEVIAEDLMHLLQEM